MIANRTTMPCARRGLAMSEMVISVAITAAAMAGVAQLMTLATCQQRTMECYSLARSEAANVMEDLMSRPWDDLPPGASPSMALSEALRQAIPDARLEVDVAPEGDSGDVRRITVRLHWQTAGKNEAQPVQLVAWRYQQPEATP